MPSVHGADRIACGKVPHVALVMYNCIVEFFRRGFCGCFAGALQLQVSRGRLSDAKMEPKSYKQQQTWNQNNI